jgi:hypothetical protein
VAIRTPSSVLSVAGAADVVRAEAVTPKRFIERGYENRQGENAVSRDASEPAVSHAE